MSIRPYLFFEGRCEEALNFYREALGAELVMLMRFKDSPEPAPGAEDKAEKVMHAAFRVAGTEVLASDGHCLGQQNFNGFALALTLPDPAAVDMAFAALSAGGEVRMPPTRTFFSPSFGVVSDRFGVSWMLMAQPS